MINKLHLTHEKSCVNTWGKYRFWLKLPQKCMHVCDHFNLHTTKLSNILAGHWQKEIWVVEEEEEEEDNTPQEEKEDNMNIRVKGQLQGQLSSFSSLQFLRHVGCNVVCCWKHLEKRKRKRMCIVKMMSWKNGYWISGWKVKSHDKMSLGWISFQNWNGRHWKTGIKKTVRNKVCYVKSVYS